MNHFRKNGWMILSLAVTFLVAPFGASGQETEVKSESVQTSPETTQLRTSLKPLTLEDMSLQDQVTVSLPMMGNDEYFGAAMLVKLEHGIKDMSFSAAFPVAIYVPPESEESNWAFVFGYITLNYKYQKCFGQGVSFCVGTSTSLSAGLEEINPDRPSEVNAHQLGVFAHQNSIFHMTEALGLQPLLILSLAIQDFFLQVESGVLFSTPIFNREDKSDFALHLNYQAIIGYELFDLIAPMVEFRGNTGLEGDFDKTHMWINGGLRFVFGKVFPSLWVAFPLNQDSKNQADIQLGISTAFEF